MRLRWISTLVLVSLSGCSLFSDGQKYSVYFENNATELNPQGNETILAAANFAQAHPMRPVAVAGFSGLPGPGQNVDGLSARRAEVVKQLLVADGVSPGRITTSANGMVDPKTLPDVAVRRVDISVGQP